MENTTEEQIIISEVKNYEDIDAEEKSLKSEDSRKQLKAILITFGIILTGFLTFTYFFFNYIEEKAEKYKQQRQQAMQKTNKSWILDYQTSPLNYYLIVWLRYHSSKALLRGYHNVIGSD